MKLICLEKFSDVLGKAVFSDKMRSCVNYDMDSQTRFGQKSDISILFSKSSLANYGGHSKHFNSMITVSFSSHE